MFLSGCATVNPYEHQINMLYGDYLTGKITYNDFLQAATRIQQIEAQNQYAQQIAIANSLQVFGQVAQNAQYQQQLYEQQRLNTITNLIHHDNSPSLQTYNYQPIKIYQREHTQCTPNGFGGFNCDTTQN